MNFRSPRLSIIIPILDEAAELPRLLQQLPSDLGLQIIFVDGGSRDASRRILHDAGHDLLATSPGRARQMNLGAAQARAEILLFLHADSALEAGAVGSLLQAMEDRTCIGGAFRLGIRSAGSALRVVEWGVRMRSLLFRMPYGDQGIFLRKETFDELGGYRNLPMMEDLDLVRRMKKRGRLVLLSKRITTSDRRWRSNGVLRTTFINTLLATLLFLRFPVGRLAQIHRRLSDPAHGPAPSDKHPTCPEATNDNAEHHATVLQRDH